MAAVIKDAGGWYLALLRQRHIHIDCRAMRCQMFRNWRIQTLLQVHHQCCIEDREGNKVPMPFTQFGCANHASQSPPKSNVRARVPGNEDGVMMAHVQSNSSGKGKGPTFTESAQKWHTTRAHTHTHEQPESKHRQMRTTALKHIHTRWHAKITLTL